MAIGTTIGFIAAGVAVATIASGARLDANTIGLVVVLAALLGMLAVLVGWDNWQPTADDPRADTTVGPQATNGIAPPGAD